MSKARLNVVPRVLFINPWDKRIGPNRYLAEMLAADAALAQKAIVVVPRDDEAAEEYRGLGCTVEIWEWAQLVHLARTRANAGRVLRTHTRGVQFAKSRMRALHPDAVMTNSENVWFGGMAARSLGLPHFQVFHALTLEHHWGGRPWMVRGYLRWLQLWSTRFVAVSQAVAEMLKRCGISEKRVRLVPNGLNMDAIRAATTPLPRAIAESINDNSPILVTLGRISKMKGHDLLIETLAQVKTKFPDVLWLVGGILLSSAGIEDTDAFFAELKQRIKTLGLESNVVFLGEIDYAPTLLKHADVYVQPSRTESFCRAVIEAMACGAPVGAFAAGALPQVVGSGGILAPAEDVNALANAIECLIGDTALRDKTIAQGQQQAQRFDVKYSVAALRELFTNG